MLPSLERVVTQAWDKFSSRAYVHHYAKYGVGIPEFEGNFATLESAVHNLRHM